MESAGGLPHVNLIGVGAPFRWLAGAWADLWKAPFPCLAYGLALTAFSLWLVNALVQSNAAFWVFALILGFVFVAPMLAMGLYEAGRKVETGERPTLVGMVLLPQALRQDVAYLGLALAVIFSIWAQIAQIVYGLSTFTLHHTVQDFVTFAVDTDAGRRMLMVGGVIGGVIAFLTFCLVVVSAPMLLDRRTSIFIATVTSVRSVTENFGPMLVWAALIVALMAAAVATGLLGLIVIFPWLGLASWRAYRDLVTEPAAPN